MDDKTFELIEKMYSEFSKRFDTLENDNKEMKDDIKTVKENLNITKHSTAGENRKCSIKT